MPAKKIQPNSTIEFTFAELVEITKALIPALMAYESEQADRLLDTGEYTTTRHHEIAQSAAIRVRHAIQTAKGD